jgi:hypothetical protein
MKEVILNNQYLEEAEMSNYFGGLNGETNEQIKTTRELWVNEMAKRGFPLGSVICDEEGEYPADFDRICQDAIDATCDVKA